jgi:hypothetical protein
MVKTSSKASSIMLSSYLRRNKPAVSTVLWITAANFGPSDASSDETSRLKPIHETRLTNYSLPSLIL